MERMIDLSFLKIPASRRVIALVTSAGLAAGVLYGLLAPRWYRSVLTVVPVKAQSGGGLSSLLGGDMGGLAAALVGGGGVAPDTSRIACYRASPSPTP
jgi:hypothetical protein